jgi:purine-nucleoside phosphorylase
MIPLEKRLRETIDHIRRKVAVPPHVGLILGSGLGDFAESLSNRNSLSTRDIPHYPLSTVEGHKGELVFATHGNVPFVAFQGRIHLYEANDIDPVLYPIRVAKELGVRILVITNAAGGITGALSPGDLMVITDQINLTAEHVDLPGNIREGSRGSLFDPRLISKLDAVARTLAIRLQHGVYAGMRGPSYESAAEVEMVRRLGGDAVGMSTVLETTLAAVLGMRILGISCITNLATGISGNRLNHQEVTEVASKVRADFGNLLINFIELV